MAGWPVVGISLTAIVAGEDDKCVAALTRILERPQQSADALIQPLHHGGEHPERAPISIALDEPVLHRVGDRPVPPAGCGIAGALPRPVGSGVVQGQVKGIGVTPANKLDRAVRQQVGHIPGLVHGDVSLMQIQLAGGARWLK